MALISHIRSASGSLRCLRRTGIANIASLSSTQRPINSFERAKEEEELGQEDYEIIRSIQALLKEVVSLGLF